MRSSFGKVFMGAAGTPTGASDDEFNRVSFLSHFDGANNGVNNSFDDSSANNYTVTAAGNVTQGSFGPYGTNWSVDFDGGDYFTVPQDADFNVDDGSYTMECFVNTTFSGYQNIIACWDGATSGNPGWGMFISSGNQFGMFVGTTEVGKAGAVVNDGAWHHLAGVFTNSGATITLYVDGAQISTGSVTAPSDNAASIIRIGSAGNASATSLYTGKISNLRLVKGTAVYSGSSFTVPTSALTAITNTKLLVLGRNNFSDGSASGHVLTPISDPAVTSFGPFLTRSVYSAGTNGASAYFDGNGDYLSIANSSDFNLAANDFCFEFWFWCDSLAQYDTILSLYNTWAIEQESSGGGIKIAMWISSGSSGDWNLLSAGIMSNLLKVNEWNHLVIARTGNTLKSYHNGAIVYNSSFNATIGSSSNILYSGTFDTSAYYWDGYISDVKLSNGSTGGINVSGNTITVPTAPLAVTDSNTKLLLNMADGQAIDSAAQTNLTLFGNAKISTGQAKFGDTSLLLDGTGDFLHLHNRRDLSGPFCIEAFARADDTGTAFLWCLGQYRLELGISEAKLRIYRVGTATAYTDFFTGGEFTVNNWHHVALVRDTSNVIKCYLNGTASGTTVTDATAFVATDNILIIGGEADGTPSGGSINHGWDGYVDDFRISDFARYTSNFTAPSEPFADKGQ